MSKPRQRQRSLHSAAPGARAAAGPSPAPGTTKRRRVALVVAVAGVACVASLAGALKLQRVWFELPVPKWRAVGTDALNRAFHNALTGLPPDARAGRALAWASEELTAALRDPAKEADAVRFAALVLDDRPRAGLARLQVLAVRMIRLERGRVPPADWWSTLQPDIGALRTADFAHHLPAWLDTATSIYTRLDLGPGTARRVATDRGLGPAHGTMLQYVTDRLGRLAAALDAEGNAEAAAQCRAVTQRILRQWLVEPGPPTLRLLAAELLSNQTNANPSATQATAVAPPSTAALPETLVAVEPWPTSAPAAVAAAARAWRESVRAELDARPAAVPLLSVYSPEPEVCPATQAQLVLGLVLAVGLLGATAGTAAVALAGGVVTIVGRQRLRLDRLRIATSGVLALGVIAAALLWPLLSPDLAHAELRRMDPQPGDNGRPYHPFVLGGAAIALLLGASVLAASNAAAGRASGGPTGSGRLSRAAAAGASAGLVMWAVLGVALLGATFYAAHARQAYEERVGAALVASYAAPVESPAATAALETIRAWQP